MLILISDAFDSSLEEKLQVFGEVTTDKSRLPEADIVMVRSKTKCTKEYIDEAKNLKLIIRGGVGIDNIDKAYAESKGILVRNTPNSSAVAVAELAFSLMLSVPTKLIQYHTGMKNGEWLKKVKRTELYGKRLALIGFGHIAQEVAKRALAFGMDVYAYDKFVQTSAFIHMVNKPLKAVKDADYISIHLPYTPDTDKFFGKELIDACTRKPVVINTGRAKTVDNEEMCRALQDGRISHYCIDVYENEPPEPTYPLLALDNVTATPHIGANTVENLLRIGEEASNLINDYINGDLI